MRYAARFLPITLMQSRIDRDRDAGDTDLFLSLMYFGEMLTKLVGSGMIAAIDDDRARLRYAQAYKLVRTNGIGDWAAAIQEIAIGAPAQHIFEEAHSAQQSLIRRHATGDWQYECVELMQQCLELTDRSIESMPKRVQLIQWFHQFARLRNSTRGHGAELSSRIALICPILEQSIVELSSNFPLFDLPWAFLKRNLSGKYRVTRLSNFEDQFEHFKTSEAQSSHYEDGVYIYFDKPRRVDLIFSDADAQDFLFPNGAFNDKSFELISYVSGDKARHSASEYLSSPEPRPPSETQARPFLDGKTLDNLPRQTAGYIRREALESQLTEVILNDRHPIVTLVGRGGIGKTSLALEVLRRLVDKEKFSAIIWFSARDIDLLQEGPKPVSPHLQSPDTIAIEFARLFGHHDAARNGIAAKAYLAEQMTNSEWGELLLVFDNFETVFSPSELYGWIDQSIRLPNKVLITTRFRDFKGDYPIEVAGMSRHESEQLIAQTARQLGIERLISPEYLEALVNESDGHPYVMKILLGEVAKLGRAQKPEHIIATREDILDALFERTYTGASPIAKRVFLTLCSWRSPVPLVALEAVIAMSVNERVDVASAVDELSRSSFIEVIESPQDDQLFLSVPLVAHKFGRGKLRTSEMRSAIESDVQILQAFGAIQTSDIEQGLPPRIERLFAHVAKKIDDQPERLSDYVPFLEFIARRHPPTWLKLAQLYQQIDFSDRFEKTRDAIRHYLEVDYGTTQSRIDAWHQLATVCRNEGDTLGEVHAIVELCQIESVDFQQLSNLVNRVNSLLRDPEILEADEKVIISQKLAEVMESRIEEGDATDCSRLAWLYMRLQLREKAQEATRRGLELDPNNLHCLNLADRIL